MSVDRNITIATIASEIEECNEYCEKYGWKLSEFNSETLSFTVHMISPVDKEEYYIEFSCDNYPEYPIFIEFYEPISNEKGTLKCYPKVKDNFFHPMPCICNPCSRKSYKDFSGNSAPHGEWQLNAWKTYKQVGTLITIPNILRAIYGRISDPEPNNYTGRMQKK